MIHLSRFDPRRSLRARIALIIALLTLILALVLSGLAGQISGDELERNIGTNLSQLSATMVDQIDRTMFERWRESRIVASQSDLFDTIDRGSIASARVLLTEIKSSYRFYAWVGWISPDGIVMAGSDGLLEGQNVANRAWFVSSRDARAPFVGDIRDDSISEQGLPQIDLSDTLPLRYIDIATPIRNTDGNLLGVIITYLDWRFVGEQAHTIEQQFRTDRTINVPNPTGRSGFPFWSTGTPLIDVLIVASDGTVLYGPPAFSAPSLSTLPKLSLTSVTNARSNTQPGYVIETWPDTNVPYLTGYAVDTGYRGFAGLGWSVLIRQRADAALASVRQLQALLFGIGMVFAIAFSSVGWLLAAQITRPLVGVVERARIITPALIQDAKTSDELRADEVVILSAAIDHLLLSLNARNSQLSALNINLERMVEQRTKDLMDSQRFNEKLINTTPDLVYIYDCTEQRNTYVNAAGHELLGYTQAELSTPANHLLPKILPREDLEHFQAQREILLDAADNTLTTQSFHFQHKAGHWLWIEVRETVFARDKAGRVAQIFGVAQDVTARKQAEEKMQELAASQERQRLARELHDSVTQTLFSATLVTQALPALWKKDENLAQTNLAELSRLTRGALAEMRTLLNELRPRALEMADMKELLEQLCDAARGRTQTEFTLTLNGEGLLPPEVQVSTYRVAQEALNNVIKHARAKHATIHLEFDSDHVEMNIRDDGRGFQHNAASTHFGLGIMYERAQEVGAEVQIASQLKEGTTVTFRWVRSNEVIPS